MNWSRAKTIFIYIFVLVNIFLIIMYRHYYAEEKRMNLDKLNSILSNNNVIVSDNIITPAPKTMAGVEISNRLNDPDKIAAAVLGSKATLEQEGSYRNGTAKITILNTEIEYRNEAPDDRGFAGANELNVGNKVMDVLNRMGMPRDTLSPFSVYRIGDDSFRVTLSYRFDGFTIFNKNISATVDTRGIIGFRGPQISCTPIQGRQYSIISREGILLEFIDSDAVKEAGPIRIIGITLGYYLPENQFNISSDAIPAYALRADDGRIFYYDARMGIAPEIRLL